MLQLVPPRDEQVLQGDDLRAQPAAVTADADCDAIKAGGACRRRALWDVGVCCQGLSCRVGRRCL
eukprot:13493542-Alexandrium_andersonii.AAC.1